MRSLMVIIISLYTIYGIMFVMADLLNFITYISSFIMRLSNDV